MARRKGNPSEHRARGVADGEELPGEREAWDSIDGLLARLNLGSPTVHWSYEGEDGVKRASSATVPWVGRIPQPSEALLVGRLLRSKPRNRELRDLLQRLATATDAKPSLLAAQWGSLMRVAKARALGDADRTWAAIALGLVALMQALQVEDTDCWSVLRDDRWEVVFDADTAQLVTDVADGGAPVGAPQLRGRLDALCTPPAAPALEVAESGRPYVLLDGKHMEYFVSRGDRITKASKLTTKHAGLRYVLALRAGHLLRRPKKNQITQVVDAFRSVGLALDLPSGGVPQLPSFRLGARLDALVPELIGRRR